MDASIDGGDEKRFTLVNRLAVGGMGEVFLARQEGPAGFVKTVAVKRILDGLSSNEDFVQMFLDEARLAARFSHPNIVQVFELGGQRDAYFMTMEFVDGRSLHAIKRAAKRKGRKLSPPMVAYVCQQALRGLHYAHELTDDEGVPLKIVHRDVTPENVLVGFNGVVKLVDFGIAKTTVNESITQARCLKGKLHYMAPEILAGAEASVHSDLYSMGVMLYELFTGAWPFPGETAAEIAAASLRVKASSPCKLNPDLPPRLGKTIVRALAKDPAKRQRSAAELAEELAAASPRFTDAQLIACVGELFEGERLSLKTGKNTPLPPANGVFPASEPRSLLRRLGRRLRGAEPTPPPLPQGPQLSAPAVPRPEAEPEKVSASQILAPEPAPASPAPELVEVEVEFEQEEPTLFTLGERWLDPSGLHAQAQADMVRVDAQTLRSAYGEVYTVPEFWIDRLPVTNADYFKFIEATGEAPPSNWRGRRYPSQHADHPVVGVTLEDARRYAAWRGVRLPTQLEWEAAARGPQNTRFPWGDTWDAARCHGPERGTGTTAPVGRIPEGASPVGCLDLVGNVWEWTEQDPAVRTPPEEGYAWVFGGSFCHTGSDNDAIPRRSVRCDKDYVYLGFRCAKGGA